MEFESPDVEKDFPGLYASESGKKSNESDFSDDAHDRPSKKDLLIGKRKDKKDSKKDRGYAALEGESSPEEDPEMKSPSKSKKSKSFKFPSKKEKREKSREKDSKEKEKEVDKEKKKDKEGKVKLKLKSERKKSKHLDESLDIPDEQPVFGVPLELAVERTHCHDGVHIPLVVRDCIDHVQEHGLNMEGIYKVSGIKSKVQHLRKLYNQREPAQLSEYEMPVITSLLKQFLRELPEPILTTELIARFEEAGAMKEMAARESELRVLITQLPSCNRLLLTWLILHFENITAHEKQNKMNAQAIAITLSPVMQMSHRLITAFLCHCNFLFPGIKLNKYIPPLTAGSPSLPDTPTGIADQLRKQESLLNQIHREMNAGFVSKRKEEQLWEVQRIITQLKRKLRTVQRAQEMSQNQKSLEEDRSSKPSEDEFRIDLTLQKAASCSEEDTALHTTELKSPATETPVQPEALPPQQQEKAQPVSSPGQPIPPPPPAQATVPTQQQQIPVASSQQPELVKGSSQDMVDSPQEISDKLPKHQVQEAVESPSACEPVVPSTSHTEHLSDEGGGEEEEDAAGGETLKPASSEELQGLLQEERVLLLEQQELLNLQADLQGRVQEERAEIERLRAELASAKSKYNFRGFDEDSSEGSSSPSHSEGSDAEDPEIRTKIVELQRDNKLLQQKKLSLVRRIMAEREACLHLRVQLSLLHLSQESKQLLQMESRQQTFRRTRSLDLTDSLDRIERRRKRREQFLENRAKFDVTLPPVSKYSNTSPYVKPLKPSNDNETSSVNFISELIQRLTIDPETQPYKSPAVNASSLLSETTSFDAPLVAEYIRTNMLEREGTQSLTGKMTPESKVQQTKNSAVYAVPLYLPEYFLSQPPKPSTEYVMDNKQSYSGESDSKISVPFSQADNNTFETVTLRRPSAFLKTGQKSNSSFALLRPSSFDALPVTESVKTTPTMPFAHSPTLPRWIDIAQTSPLLQTENASKPNGTSSECQSRIPLSTDSNLIQKKQLSLHKASVLRRSSSLQQVPAVESNKKCISTSSDISHSRQQNWRNQVVRASQEIGSKDHISNKFGNRYFDVVQSPKLDRRYSSNSLTFPRRSLTPTIPVKSLVQKFSFGK